MSFANQTQGLGNAYEGIQQQTMSKLTKANDAYTQALKLTQLDFDSAESAGKSLVDGGVEGLAGLEGAHQLWRAGKKVYNKLKAKADEFNKNQMDKLDQEAADRTEDSFKVKVEGEDEGDGLENINDDENFDEVADTGQGNVEDFAPYRDAPTGELADEGGELGEELGDFGENLGGDIFENLSSNIGEMGGEVFSNALNAFKQAGQNGIDAMNDLFNGIRGGGGTSQPEIEMTDMGDPGRMPIDADYPPEPTEFSTGNFGEKVPVSNDEGGIELTDFQKNAGSLEEEGQNLEQTEGDAEKAVETKESGVEDLEDGDINAAEDVDPEIEDALEDVGEDLAGEAVEEGVSAALSETPIGWILGIGGGIAAAITSGVGIAKEVKARANEESALTQAQNQYNLAKAQVANFNPSGQYAVPSLNSLSMIGQ